jgi:hypothetical protein
MHDILWVCHGELVEFMTAKLHPSLKAYLDLPTMLEFGKKLFPEKIPEDIKIIAIGAEDITTISFHTDAHRRYSRRYQRLLR